MDVEVPAEIRALSRRVFYVRVEKRLSIFRGDYILNRR